VPKIWQIFAVNPFLTYVFPTPSKLSEMYTKRSFQVVIVRHGERADSAFGSDWTTKWFVNGEYLRQDLNMPSMLPTRPLQHWAADPPLTELGRWQAQQVGEAVAELANIGQIVCSPAWRCLQTADEFQGRLPGMPPVLVEPGLLEMGVWCVPGLHDALPERDPRAITFLPSPDEEIEEWYVRSDSVLRALLDRHAETGKGDLLIVAHGLSHEVLTHGCLSRSGPIPPKVLAAQGFNRKHVVLSELCKHGHAPLESFCGVAVLHYSSWNDELSSVNTSKPVSLTHGRNPTFNFMRSSNTSPRGILKSGSAGNFSPPAGASIDCAPAVVGCSPRGLRSSRDGSCSVPCLVTGHISGLASGSFHIPPQCNGVRIPLSESAQIWDCPSSRSHRQLPHPKRSTCGVVTSQWRNVSPRACYHPKATSETPLSTKLVRNDKAMIHQCSTTACVYPLLKQVVMRNGLQRREPSSRPRSSSPPADGVYRHRLHSGCLCMGSVAAPDATIPIGVCTLGSTVGLLPQHR